MVVKSIGRAAFDAVYESNADVVYRTALYYSGNHHAAEEITQTVFLKLYINMEHVNMKVVRSWLITTAKYAALNYNRDSLREIPTEETVVKKEYVESLEDGYIKKLREKEYQELAGNIFAELYRVNERWYDAVTITYFLEKPQKEVAEIMGISLEVLHGILYRAKQWIRKNYAEEFAYLNDA